MTHSVTAHLVTLTFEAALKSFWRRNALRKFLRDCHISESHISSWPDEETKRDFLDRTFASLQRAPNGKAVIAKMAHALSEQTTFPDLRNWEDSDAKISAAKQAVRELKVFLLQQEEKIRDEREVEEAKKRTREEHQIIRRERMDLEKLRDRLTDLHMRIGDARAGYEFQDWFYELLDFSEVQNRRPYVTGGRQIDGAVTIDGTTYLIELKFTNGQAAGPDIDIFRSKVESKADNTMGIFVSMSAYSTVAVAEASGRKTSILLLDASHIFLVLTGAMNLGDVIRRVRRHASQTGEAHLPVASFGG